MPGKSGKQHRIKGVNPVERPAARYNPTKRNQRGRMHIDSMSSKAGRKMCMQLLGQDVHDGEFYLPSDLEATREGVLADVAGGTSMEFRTLVNLDASTSNNCGFITVQCNSTGYSDSLDLAHTAATYTGTTPPVANPTTGVTFTSSTPLSLVTKGTVRGQRNAIVYYQYIKFVRNTASAMDRAGILQVGWFKSPAEASQVNLNQYPGGEAYDLAQIEDDHYPVVCRPPWALTVNDEISGESVDYGATKGGVLVMSAYNLPAGSSITVEVVTGVFYYGDKIAVNHYPVFSTMAYDCALTCWLRLFGRAVSYPRNQTKLLAKKVNVQAGVHTLHHTAQPLVQSAWDKAKEWGMSGLKWLGKEAVKIIPEALTALL